MKTTAWFSRVRFLLLPGLLYFAAAPALAQKPRDIPRTERPRTTHKTEVAESSAPCVMKHGLFGVDSGSDGGSSNLVQISTATAEGTTIGETGFVLTDVAFSADGRLFGVTFDTLLQIDPCTGVAQPVGTGLGISGANALAFDGKGNLFTATVDTGELYTIDPATGIATIVGPFGPNLYSSGDLVFAQDGMLYGVAVGSPFDVLITVNPQTGAATEVPPGGHMGFAEVFGLAFDHKGRLLGAADGDAPSPTLIVIDRATGIGESVGTITNANGLYGLSRSPGFLSFPIPNRTAATAEIVSVSDHHMTPSTIYGLDPAVVAYTGEAGLSKCGADSVTHPGYRKGDLATDTCLVGETFRINDHYVGLNNNLYLQYDQHPGFDFRTVDQATSGRIGVFTAAGGIANTSASESTTPTAQSLCSVNSLSSWGGVVIFLDPPFQDYLLCYLHLLTPILIVDGAHVNKGDRLGTSDGTAAPSTSSPCGSGVVCPHLHFEVRKRVPSPSGTQDVPVDPYGWQGLGDDPWSSLNGFPSDINQPLWETCTDPYKPNSPIEKAFGPLAPATSYSGKICSTTDESYFKIAVTSPGTVSLSMDVPDTCLNNYDLELYDPAQNLISSSSNGPGQAETISFDATVDGTYYIKVFGVPLDASAQTCDDAVILPEPSPRTFNTSAPYRLSGTWPSPVGKKRRVQVVSE